MAEESKDGSLLVRFAWRTATPWWVVASASLSLAPFVITAAVSEEDRVPMVVIGVPFTVALLYFFAAQMLNRTTLQVSPGHLSVRHGPLPFWRGRDLEDTGLAQLYVKLVEHNTKGGDFDDYELRAIIGEREETLIVGLDQKEQALWLEQEIEQRLRIEDRAVEGELSRD